MAEHMIFEMKEKDSRAVAGSVQKAKVNQPSLYYGMKRLLSASSIRNSNPQTVIQLQRTLGNQFVQRSLEMVRCKDEEGQVRPEIENNIDQAKGGGRSLDSIVQARMENTFGTDFSGVRIHTGSHADSLNRSLHAKAFTTGRDIFFGEGNYNPGSSAGRELLAHELTHVVQQSDDVQPKLSTKLSVGQAGDMYETEADSVARDVMRVENQGVQRQVEEEEENVQLQPEEEEEPIQAKQNA